MISFLRGLTYVLTEPRTFLLASGLGLALLVCQFPATFLLGFLGLRDLWHRERAVVTLLLLIMLGDVAFLLSAIDPRTGGDYVWNLHYYLQAYVAFAMGIAAGFKTIETRWIQGGRKRQTASVLLTFALPVLVYAAAPSLARPFTTDLPGFRALSGRDNLTYALSPWKFQETGARDFGEKILNGLPPHSVLLADYSLWAVVRYLHSVEGLRPDVQIVQLPYAGRNQQVPVILQYHASAEVFLADTIERYYDMPEIREHFEVKSAGLAYHLAPK